MNKQLKIIAGPCSIESMDQCLSTAKQLSNNGITIFRGSAWKPRTKPGGFVGIGPIGLEILQKVREETGMKVGCEVATVDQCRLALLHEIDYLWIGSRTATDPFAVQQIADNIKQFINGYGKEKKEYINNLTIYVKNPPCPDYNLWVGAIERIKSAGVKNVGAIFRGFKVWPSTKYRNEPIWDIPLKLMNEFPTMEVICDPSHIAGDTQYIQEICDLAIEYGFDGLMVESHCNPSAALTDAKQQLTPTELDDVINNLPNVTNVPNDEVTKEDLALLNHCRAEITRGDRSIVNLLISRMHNAILIGNVKRKMNEPILQKDRWKKVKQNVFKQVKTTRLYEENQIEFDYLINTIFDTIHAVSCKLQSKNLKV